MTLLTALRLRRPNGWEPPTLLDTLLVRPLLLLVHPLYRLLLLLRGRPVVPPSRSRSGRSPIRIVCVSDTHDQTVPLPPGDLLVHAGDLTNAGTPEDVQRQVDWLAGQDHRYKVVVPGNHDGWFDARVRRLRGWGGGARARAASCGVGEERDGERRGMAVDVKGVQVLQGMGVTLEFDGGRKLNVWGAGDIPACGGEDFAFQYERGKEPWRNRIPDDTDVLITHTPPLHHLDNSLGCPALLAEIWRVRPRLHIFGHVHWGHGTESIFWDDCQRCYESFLSRTPRGLFLDLIPHAGWVDAAKMLVHGVHAVLWKWLMGGPGSNNGSLMVNAAQMYGNTGRIGRKPIVVEL